MYPWGSSGRHFARLLRMSHGRLQRLSAASMILRGYLSSTHIASWLGNVLDQCFCCSRAAMRRVQFTARVGGRWFDAARMKARKSRSIRRRSCHCPPEAAVNSEQENVLEISFMESSKRRVRVPRSSNHLSAGRHSTLPLRGRATSSAKTGRKRKVRKWQLATVRSRLSDERSKRKVSVILNTLEESFTSS